MKPSCCFIYRPRSVPAFPWLLPRNLSLDMNGGEGHQGSLFSPTGSVMSWDILFCQMTLCYCNLSIALSWQAESWILASVPGKRITRTAFPARTKSTSWGTRKDIQLSLLGGKRTNWAEDKYWLVQRILYRTRNCSFFFPESLTRGNCTGGHHYKAVSGGIN